jgi:mRNA interferase MazF
MWAMNRGSIYWCDFEPATGAEVKKLRPAIIISNNISNKYIDVVQVVPLTSNIKSIYPGECIIDTPDKKAKVLGSQITTLDKSRVKNNIGVVSYKDMLLVEQAIMLQLGIKA